MLRRIFNPTPVEYIETNDQYPWSEAAIRRYRVQRKHARRRARILLIALVAVLMLACVVGCLAYSKSSISPLLRKSGQVSTTYLPKEAYA